MNARSIVNKVDELTDLVNSLEPYLIFITETWLCSDISDSHLCLKGYSVFRKDRADGSAYGGVLIAVKSTLNSSEIIINTDLEVMTVQIELNRRFLKLGLVYRPPAITYDLDGRLYELLKRSFETEMNFVIFGDFNLPRIDWRTLSSNSSRESNYLNLTNELNMYQMVIDQTRENNILDICLASNPDIVQNLVVNETFSTSDHSYITCDIKFSEPPIEPTKIFHNFKHADWDLMRSHLAIVDWEETFNYCGNTNVDKMWEFFKETIVNMTELYVPTYVPRPGKKPPWMTRELSRLIQTKKRKWRNYKKK